MCYSHNKKKVFTPASLGVEHFKNDSFVQHDLKTLYVQACKELTLQQEKRDKTISIYVAVIAFLVPFLFSKETAFKSFDLDMGFAGWVLMIAGIIGLFFTLSVIRYRVYKEVYWLTCRVIAQMQNVAEQHFTKEIIQAIFLQCMVKKWGKYLAGKGEYKYDASCTKRIPVKYVKLVLNNINSAEYYMFATIALVASALVSFGLYLALWDCMPIWGFFSLAAVLFVLLSVLYFKGIVDVFRVLSDHRNDSFNFAFGKAWFLHIYKDF